jgi:uncharacterized LabA/DUF88 family protein
MAKNLSQLIKTLGRTDRKIALVAKEDDRSHSAYAQAGYETNKISGDRTKELGRFIRRTITEIKEELPKHLVLVSDDSQFAFLCDSLPEEVNLSVWANSATAPTELKDMKRPGHYFQTLEELLPNLKIPQVDVRIDLENIFIGLVKRGWRPDMHELIAAIRRAMEEKSRGDIVSITGYADFAELNRHHGGSNMDWQRELTLAGGESRYVVNQRGKNTADMKIADDIRTVVDQDSGSTGAIDVIGLVTMDRDFRHVVERVKVRGKKAIVMGLQDGLSRELATIASEVCYLDQYLKLPQAGRQESQRTAPPPPREEAAFMMKVGAWMNQNRFRFVFRDRLEEQFAEESESLNKLIADGWLSATRNSSFDGQNRARILEPNPDHTGACAARYLSGWIPSRVDYCLNQKGMPHVDSNFLANGMTRDRVLAEMGVGQTRSGAEEWLQAAAAAKLVVATEQPHPLRPDKLITTWRLPEKAAAGHATPVEETESTEPPVAQVVNIRKAAPRPDLAHLRDLLTSGLNDNDLNGLLLDRFTYVYRKVEGSAKYDRVQALLEHVERNNEYEKLVEAIREKNPSLFELPLEQAA